MKLGKIIGKVVAAPIKAVVSLPEVAADVVEEVGGAFSGKEDPKK